MTTPNTFVRFRVGHDGPVIPFPSSYLSVSFSIDEIHEIDSKEVTTESLELAKTLHDIYAKNEYKNMSAANSSEGVVDSNGENDVKLTDDKNAFVESLYKTKNMEFKNDILRKRYVAQQMRTILAATYYTHDNVVYEFI
jgi:hypothetical protein